MHKQPCRSENCGAVCESDPARSFQTVFHGCVTASYGSEPAAELQNLHLTAGGNKHMIIIGLFSKGGEAVHFSSEGMANIYTRGQERVRRQRRYYPTSRRDEASPPLHPWRRPRLFGSKAAAGLKHGGGGSTQSALGTNVLSPSSEITG